MGSVIICLAYSDFSATNAEYKAYFVLQRKVLNSKGFILNSGYLLLVSFLIACQNLRMFFKPTMKEPTPIIAAIMPAIIAPT